MWIQYSIHDETATYHWFIYFHCFIRELHCMHISQCIYHFLFERPEYFLLSVYTMLLLYFCAHPQMHMWEFPLRYITKNGMIITSFHRKCRIICQSDCINMHSHQQNVNSVTPPPTPIPISINICLTLTHFWGAWNTPS